MPRRPPRWPAAAAARQRLAAPALRALSCAPTPDCYVAQPVELIGGKASSKPALRQPHKTLNMTVRIDLRDGDDLAAALRKLRQKVQYAHGRPWSKPRRGYYEKPSVIRRKRAMTRGWGDVKLWMSLEKLHRREGPFARGQ